MVFLGNYDPLVQTWSNPYLLLLSSRCIIENPFSNLIGKKSRMLGKCVMVSILNRLVFNTLSIKQDYVSEI